MQRGMALLVVLWIMTLLTTIAFTLSFLVRVENFGTLAFRQDVQNRYLSEGGISRAIMEILYRNSTKLSEIKLEPWRLDGRANYGMIAGGKYSVRITGEDGKLDINLLSDSSGVILGNILRNAGVEPEEADSIVDCVLDWKDADNLHRLNGVEDEYYLSLKNPYRARNGEIESLEELLLIKGVTPEILFGGKGKKGIIGLLTVHSRSSTINPNSAPREILAAIPGIGPEAAERIVAHREISEFNSIEEVRGIAGGDFESAARYLDIGEPAAYTIESVGYRDDETKGYPVRAIIKTESGGLYSFLLYKCPTESER